MAIGIGQTGYKPQLTFNLPETVSTDLATGVADVASSPATGTGTVFKTLASLGSLASGVGAVGSFVSGLVGGYLQNKQAEKAQAYQEKWAERLYADQKKQQEIQNKLNAENQAMNRATQYYNQQAALRSEARTDGDRWYQRMQNAANKYDEILNKSRSLRKETAAALQNR